MNKYVFVAAALCFITAAKSQDSLNVVQLKDVVVTGNKIETPIEKSGKTIFKLDKKAIETNRGKDVTDLLNEIPGVQINGNFATPGTDVSYRIRGAQSEQTLILIDGIPYNDPSGLAQTFDLRMLDLDQVESIEVLKGGLGSLYGTGAAAGVINIKLKEGVKKPFGTIVNTEYGSFNTFSSNVNVSGKANKLDYLVSGSYRSSDGFSAALDTIGGQGFDDDNFESMNFMGRLGYQFSDQFSIRLFAAYDNIESGFDAGSFRDNDSELDQKLVKVALSPKYQWTSGSIQGNFSYHANERIFNSPNRSDPNERDISEFNGNALQADIIVDQILTDKIKLIGGINFQRPVWEPEDVDSESFTMVDPYASLIYDHANFNLQLGGRLNNHSLYGSNFVWNVNPSYVFGLGKSKLKVLGSYATSFLSPSLNQLYAGDFGFLATDAGNPDLEPQDSETAEGGLEWIVDQKLRFGAVYFYRKDTNRIDFESTADFSDGMYINMDGESEVDGLELNASYAFFSQLTLAGHYTYTKSLTDDVILRRVPENKFGFTLSAIPVKKMLVKLTHLHVGEVPENDEITLEAYNLFDGFVSYTFNQLTISGSINNIFDADYVDRFGWATAERNYNIGLRYEF
ncbi:MAG: TonB-dependent receptor plug domain-containing protein [Bacteroidota bacterium]